MQAISINLQILSAFGTNMRGDTLFGQLCWAVRHRYGEEKLNKLLDHYSTQPFLIVSDAFPKGYLPKPCLPAHFFCDIDPTERKKIKKQIWMPIEQINLPVQHWQENCKTNTDISPEEKRPQPHNTINRLTGTTGEEGFAPYNMSQTWYQTGAERQLHLLLDTEQLTQEELKTCLCDIGNFGFGRDATIGLGKFCMTKVAISQWQTHPQANAVMTLSPSAPQGLGFEPQHSYYQLFNRFGRHGDIAVHQHGKPFKNPILMADTAAVFKTETKQSYIGQGLGGGKQKISLTIPETVQQGYAPVIPIYIEEGTS